MAFRSKTSSPAGNQSSSPISPSRQNIVSAPPIPMYQNRTPAPYPDPKPVKINSPCFGTPFAQNNPSQHAFMLKSFLQIAIRNFAKRKGYSILNLLGLTIGMTCCLLIFEYVAYERSYDGYNANANRIYRVQENDYQGGRLEARWATTSPAVAPTLKKDFPGIESF